MHIQIQLLSWGEGALDSFTKSVFVFFFCLFFRQCTASASSRALLRWKRGQESGSQLLLGSCSLLDLQDL